MPIFWDRLWKGIIQDFFAYLLLYFFPQWAEKEVDFDKNFEFLDKELEALVPDKNQKYVDKLVKVYLKDQDWLLVHIEAQGYPDPHFAKRMYGYYSRIRDKYDKPVIALAIYTDNNPAFHPKAYLEQKEETSLLFHFKTFKLIEKSEAELYVAGNPFSIATLAAKKALEKQPLGDVWRLAWAKELVLTLKSENYDDKQIRRLLHFIGYCANFEKTESLAAFNAYINEIFPNREGMGVIEEIEEGLKEQVYLKGLEEGIQKGIEQGIQKGMEKGIEIGTERGIEKGKEESIRKLIAKSKMSLQEIADLFELSLEEVLRIKDQTSLN
jgi:predicted transposase YdaD